MSSVLNLVMAEFLSPDLREGAKFYCESGSGLIKAVGSRAGTVAIWSEGSQEVHYLNVQPVKRKNKSEAELQGLWLSQTGDILLAATSVDVVAINTSSRTLSWSYQQKRQWGFLPSIPQGGHLSVDDDLTVYYSSGEVVTLDRKGRSIGSSEFRHTAQMQCRGADRCFGSDGHLIWKWNVHEGFGGREQIGHHLCYSMACSSAGDTIATRTVSRILILDSHSGVIQSEFACNPGLPQIAMNSDGTYLGALSEGRVSFYAISGEQVGEYDSGDDFAISLHRGLEGAVIGLRSGKLARVAWPD